MVSGRGLRIADASVFPRIPGAHLQAPVVMVVEGCACFIAEDAAAVNQSHLSSWSNKTDVAFQ
jgi:choline dehydrogenase-like flavoprotein